MSSHDPMVRLLHMRDHAGRAVEMARGRDRSELDKDDIVPCFDPVGGACRG